MAWNLDSDRPIYTQLMEIIQQRVVAGEYKPGEKIPSVRELAAQAGVNPNTMQKALSDLEDSGLVVTQRTSGRVVTEDVELISQVREQLAMDRVMSFISKMSELGYDKQQTTALLEKAGGEKNE